MTHSTNHAPDPSTTTSSVESNRPIEQDAAERVYSERDLWYFKTRDGDQVGPFRYRSEAESNLDRFMAQLKERV